MVQVRVSPAEFDAVLDRIGGGVPDAAEYVRLTKCVLDMPDAARLNELDPFSNDYRQGVLDLYLTLRSRPDEGSAGGYHPERDEAPSYTIPEAIWTGLVPWSFRDAAMTGEHLYAWGHILRHLGLQPGGSVLEYGPGSGQLLLMLARMGYRACGVDIDTVAVEVIRRQAAEMDLPVEVEQARFGQGFGTERFDAVVFYEAFHHSVDFQALLRRLHDRIKPGGRLLLCGEPVVEAPRPDIPYAWGPRLDALSVFCMRRFGWMELGFSHGFLMEAARRAGWQAAFHPFPDCGRASLYVLTPMTGEAGTPPETERPGTSALPPPR
ncbi:class I SAM-dependent methyltransferase [Roseomonas gilardii subsp. gilardii]|uniref:class I SAM-dependent methyltransferase n=1 Tax=Roseomonas gilardii TaxID=257708 RepID=UPI001FF8DE4E|nr:class I SAM-dependent methyltransferase [Roseomonas gilardii]UPG73789.1 class I SAM-dependent methyltransferase [Roseomonas gilardii subsp. gilardii]